MDFDVNRRSESEIQRLAEKLHLIADKIDDVEDLLRRDIEGRTARVPS
jgi:uncharacterized membrane protein